MSWMGHKHKWDYGVRVEQAQARERNQDLGDQQKNHIRNGGRDAPEDCLCLFAL